MKTRIIVALAAAILELAIPNVCAQGFGFVVPSGSTSGDGNSSTFRPFSVPDSRFQQIYGLQNLFSTDTYIKDLIFRLDTTNGSRISGQTADVQVRMSTTSRAVDSLSPVYGDNIGADESLVFSGTIQWFANHVPGNNPHGFELLLIFQQPFLYRPSLGNLLIDFTVNGSTIDSQIDAWTRSSDSVSSVFGASSLLSGTPSTLGLVTHLGGTLVPEPSTYALLALGLVTLLLSRKRTRR